MAAGSLALPTRTRPKRKPPPLTSAEAILTFQRSPEYWEQIDKHPRHVAPAPGPLEYAGGKTPILNTTLNPYGPLRAFSGPLRRS